MPYKDKKVQNAYQNALLQRRRREWLAGKSCASCGTRANLEVDHIDPAQKVTHRVWSWREERRLEELTKCQALCTECHKSKTKQMYPERQCGTVTAYRHGCRCEKCRVVATAARMEARRRAA